LDWYDLVCEIRSVVDVIAFSFSFTVGYWRPAGLLALFAFQLPRVGSQTISLLLAESNK
jgi:hypothetical protein